MNTTNKNLFLETAWDIGCKLMQDAIWHEDQCNWLGYWIEPVNGTYQPVMRTFGADAYSGTAGIACFLAALYSATSDKLVLRTLEGTVEQVKATMSSSPDYGFYAGKAGIATVLMYAGSAAQREDWTQAGIDLLQGIPNKQLSMYETDVISGAAGTIPVLTAAARLHGEDALLEKAAGLGNVLCEMAHKQGALWSWATVPSKRHLTGFSHGASGISLALLQLHQATGEDRYMTGAQGGFLYERQAFDHLQQNWPDFRDDVPAQPSGAQSCGVAWCHGAPGIAISRAEAGRINPDAHLSKELDVALATTSTGIYQSLQSRLSDTNFSLCHGIAGNADIILESGNSDHQKLAEAVGLAGISTFAKNGAAWPSGLNTTQQTPGLMMGLAGTGYFYLRLSDPKKYPTILLPRLFHAEA